MKKFIWSLCVFLLFSSCNLLSSKNNNKELDEYALERELIQENTEKMKRIFFVLPSPMEISSLIKTSGVLFQEELLNKTENLPGYSTSPSRAIALGVYCADLSYASLYEQYQLVMEYMNVSRNLAESLGILKTVDPEKIRLLENNVMNKNLIVDVVSDIYLESNDQLREQERYSLAALMLIGAWVESMYLATQSVQTSEKTHEELIKQILDQKLSLESIKTVLRDNQSDSMIKPIYLDVLQLEKLFERSFKTINTKESDDYIENVDDLVFVELVAKVEDMRDYLVY
ncbi:hypothetical protein [Labilibaculum sp.]|uniref:hypothetical protein n=1 Tax=Labilibaculum sp. TaxID=2060723 RepID=UPI0035687F26